MVSFSLKKKNLIFNLKKNRLSYGNNTSADLNRGFNGWYYDALNYAHADLLYAYYGIVENIDEAKCNDLCNGKSLK